MYSKVYWIGCDPAQADNLMEHYNSVVIPAVKSSEYHVGHHMIEAGSGKWLLVSNYHDKAASEAAVPLVQELVKPMVEQFGVTLEVITQGDVTLSF